MTTIAKCQAANPATCTDPQCPERRGIREGLKAASAANDFTAFLKLKEAEKSRNPQPKLTSLKQKAPKITTPAEFKQSILKDFPDVKLYISGDTEGYVVLDTIVIPKDQRGTGAGTKIMERLTKVADQNNWQLALTPSDSFGSSKNRLEVFYRRFGFIKNAGRNKDYEIMQSMIRPRSS
jgi:hypothetical protein